MMGRIYASAKSVRVWLGGPPRGVRHNEDPDTKIVLWLKLMMLRSQAAKISPQEFEDGDNYLSMILGSDWFEQVWVIQELGLARDVLFQLGRIIISSDTLFEVVQQDRIFHAHQHLLLAWDGEGKTSHTIFFSQRLGFSEKSGQPGNSSSHTKAKG